MKRADIREAVEQHLARIGLGRGSFVWQPSIAQLWVVIGDSWYRLTLRSGMSKRDLRYQLGYLAGLAEAAGLTTRWPNGRDTAPIAFDLPPMPGEQMSLGMPA